MEFSSLAIESRAAASRKRIRVSSFCLTGLSAGKTRERKNGKSSLYLEYYMGYEKTPEGKFIYKRKKENLDLEIFTSPKNTKQREHNKTSGPSCYYMRMVILETA